MSGAVAPGALDVARPLLRSLARLQDPGLRVLCCQRALLDADALSALDLLAALIGLCLSAEHKALEAYLCLLIGLCDLKADQRGVDLALRLREAHLLAAPDPLREAVAACLLTTCPPHHRAPLITSQRGADRDLTLGHKLSLAAQPSRGAVFERLLLDPHPTVVARMCLNPRLTLQDVLRVTSRRPIQAPVLWAIARSPKWLAQPAVRASLALNPYSESTLCLHLLPSLPVEVVADLASSSGHHPTLRAAALHVQACRASLRALLRTPQTPTGDV